MANSSTTMMKNKKATIYFMFSLVLLTLFVLSMAFVLLVDSRVIKDRQDNVYDIGRDALNIQLGVFDADRHFLFFDMAAEHAVRNTILQFAQNGGYYRGSKCGEYKGDTVWYYKGDKCFPDELDIEFSKLFAENMAKYAAEYYKLGALDSGRPPEDEDVEITGVCSDDLVNIAMPAVDKHTYSMGPCVWDGKYGMPLTPGQCRATNNNCEWQVIGDHIGCSVDCSGLVTWVYRRYSYLINNPKYNIFLGDSYSSQMKRPNSDYLAKNFGTVVDGNPKCGTRAGVAGSNSACVEKPVDTSKLQKGDLLFFGRKNNPGRYMPCEKDGELCIGHVNMYIGDGKAIDAGKTPVRVVDVTKSSSYVGARRLCSA